MSESRKHNPDWQERQKPCSVCGERIGDEAMVTGAQIRYHARCLKELSERTLSEHDKASG